MLRLYLDTFSIQKGMIFVSRENVTFHFLDYKIPGVIRACGGEFHSGDTPAELDKGWIAIVYNGETCINVTSQRVRQKR